jgi:hypothetical protein
MVKVTDFSIQHSWWQGYPVTWSFKSGSGSESGSQSLSQSIFRMSIANLDPDSDPDPDEGLGFSKFSLLMQQDKCPPVTDYSIRRSRRQLTHNLRIFTALL